MTSPNETTLLLESYLKALRLPTFLQNYRRFGEDAAQADQPYDRYLLALAQQEAAQRDRNRQVRRIKGAHFPVLKELGNSSALRQSVVRCRVWQRKRSRR